MGGLIDDIEAAFSNFGWTNALEVIAIAVVFYALLRLMRGTTAMSVVRGMVFVAVAVSLIGRMVDSVVLNWIVSNALTVLLILVLIVFQPEFRRVFEHVGRLRAVMHWGGTRQPYRNLGTIVATAADHLSQQRTGGLFVLERETGLEELAGTGVRLGAAPTSDLLESIFWPGSPLHDGAVLLRPAEVVAAAVILPTSIGDVASRSQQDARLGGHIGTRHRAALSITEITDAVAVVVSEETGEVSVVVGGALTQGVSSIEVEQMLAELLHVRGWGDRVPVGLWQRSIDRNLERRSTAGGDAGS